MYRCLTCGKLLITDPEVFQHQLLHPRGTPSVGKLAPKRSATTHRRRQRRPVSTHRATQLGARRKRISTVSRRHASHRHHRAPPTFVTHI